MASKYSLAHKWPFKSIVEVEWIDSLSSNGWRRPEDHHQNMEDTLCKSVGFFVKEDKKFLSLGQSQGLTTGNVADVIHIPKFAILKRRTLK